MLSIVNGMATDITPSATITHTKNGKPVLTVVHPDGNTCTNRGARATDPERTSVVAIWQWAGEDDYGHSTHKNHELARKQADAKGYGSATLVALVEVERG